MQFHNAHLLSSKQLDFQDIEKVMKIAKELEPIAKKQLTSDLLRGKVLASLFLEPSTRTRLSFESAMNRLGGKVISVTEMEQSSIAKGESLSDMAHMVSLYSDVIALRHREPGSVEKFAKGALVPTINAGDGSHEHPTQSLTDIYTIFQEKGAIDGLTIALIGDLKYSRTIHSLVYLLCHFSVKLIFVSPPELKISEEFKQCMHEKGVYFEETENFEKAISKSDVVYMTRIQRERFSSKSEYERFYGVYVINRHLIERCNPNAVILAPFPRCGEITEDTDQLKGAAYFRQARNGIAIRMALLAMMLGKI